MPAINFVAHNFHLLCKVPLYQTGYNKNFNMYRLYRHYAQDYTLQFCTDDLYQYNA